MVSINKLKTSANTLLDLSLQPCTPDLNNLPIVNNNCCLVGNTITSSRYIESLDLVVNPISIPYKKVCSGFCKDGLQKEDICLNGTGQTEYNNCINLTEPKNCTSISTPVAALGTTYYYANSAGNSTCLNTVVC